MAYPKDRLNPGEEIVLDRNPHWTYMLGGAVVVVLAFLVFVAFIALTPFWWAGLIILVLAALSFGGRFLQWKTTEFVVTTDRIITRVGVVAKHGTEIPLDRVMNISYRQSVQERLLGVGDLVIESAGENGQQFFSDVADPSKVQNIIYRQTEIYTQHGPNNGLGDEIDQEIEKQQESEARSQNIPDQIAQLDKLRKEGILTDEEFRQKKQQLLDRI